MPLNPGLRNEPKKLAEDVDIVPVVLFEAEAVAVDIPMRPFQRPTQSKQVGHDRMNRYLKRRESVAEHKVRLQADPHLAQKLSGQAVHDGQRWVADRMEHRHGPAQ